MGLLAGLGLRKGDWRADVEVRRATGAAAEPVRCWRADAWKRGVDTVVEVVEVFQSGWRRSWSAESV
jgi:hypothetical protein